jgi:hypothetical protein
MYIHIEFTPADVAQVEAFVAQMQSVKNNIHKVEQTPGQAYGNQMAGKLGELAFGKHFNWPVDLSIGLGGDGGVDFRLKDGLTVDTKSIWVQTNMDYDYTLALLAAERLSTHFVQILVDVAFTHAVITGGISTNAVSGPRTSNTRRRSGASAVGSPRSSRPAGSRFRTSARRANFGANAAVWRSGGNGLGLGTVLGRPTGRSCSARGVSLRSGFVGSLAIQRLWPNP